MVFTVFDAFPHLRCEAFAVADDPHAHIVLHENLILKIRQHQVHQCLNLLRRTIPILRTKRVERQKLHPEMHSLLRDSSHSLHPPHMTSRTRQPLSLGPSAIAIHDNSNMLRYTIQI